MRHPLRGYAREANLGGIGPFFICDVITLGVFLAFPEVITWLPDQMMKR